MGLGEPAGGRVSLSLTKVVAEVLGRCCCVLTCTVLFKTWSGLAAIEVPSEPHHPEVSAVLELRAGKRKYLVEEQTPCGPRSSGERGHGRQGEGGTHPLGCEPGPVCGFFPFTQSLLTCPCNAPFSSISNLKGQC